MKTEPEEREVLAAAASRAAAMVLCALDALEKEARGGRTSASSRS